MLKLLHSRGFNITFVNSEFNHQRLLKSRHPNSLQGFHILSLCESTTTTCLAPFRNLLARISCIVSDGAMTFTLEAAEELGIAGVVFWTASACGCLACMHCAKLIEMGYVPIKGELHYLTNGYLDTVEDGIPGMKGVRLRDFPTFIRTNHEAGKASAIVLDTFEDLEQGAIDTLSSILPPIYTVVPSHLLEKQVDDKGLDELGSGLWKEDTECLKLHDSKEPNSVVYVNFGSITVMTPDQLNQSFLWIIRPDLVSAGAMAILPPEFLESTKEIALLANWCPQEKVLSHPSVVEFLTQSGWNSTLESICSGVPVICWPFFAEQQTNCWGVGVEIETDVKKEEVEKSLVRKVMVGDEGKEMKKRAMEWKKLAQESAKSSSYENLGNVINQVLCLKGEINYNFS
ncbi:hypothetical protein Pfo_016706 [Paulownia fortunei]|nr:hypothetical protein Pfo_016706 [Paulownia fortunei]